MPRFQYAGAPSTPPPLAAQAIAGNLTAATAGTYSFWLQTQSRGGFSLVSDRAEVLVTAGQGIQLTIPASTLPSLSNGVDIRAYSILCSITSDPFDAVIVASKPGFATDDTTVLSPPFTINFSEDEHLNLTALSVASSGSLPTGNDLLNGMHRSVDDLSGVIYEWSDAQSAWLVAVPQVFTGYVTNLEGGRGANQSLAAFTDITEVIHPTYDLTGFSVPVKYWLVNNESSAISQGKRIGITVSADIEGVDTDLTNLAGVIGGLELTFLGFANATTGVLDTTGTGDVGTMDGVGESITYTGDGDTALLLQKNLPSGSAYVLQVRANFDVATLSTLIPDGTTIKVTPAFFDEAATPNDAAKITGSVILGEYDRRRLVPTSGVNALALNGSGILSLPLNQGFSFANVGQQTVTGLIADTADQNVAINVSGDCIVVDTVPDYAALRAIVGTVDGQGKATAWSAPVTLSSSLVLSLQVTYPTAIRADYDDVIAGSSSGTFNADIVRVYVRPTGGGNAIYWDFPVTPSNSSDTFTVGTIAGTDSGGTEPPNRPNDRFGLYEPADDSFTPTPTGGPSAFTAQDYEVAIAFRFDTTVTSIDHRPSSGCITEVDGTLADLFQIANYLGAPVDTVWDLRSITASDRSSNKEIFCAAQGNSYRWQSAETSTQDAALTFSTATSPGPASGQVRLNNAALASVTTAYISETDRNSTSIASLLAAISENNTLRLQSATAENTYAEYIVSAISDSGTYRTLTVAHSASNGTFDDAEAIVASWGTEFVRPFDVAYPSAGRWVKDDSDQILVLDAVPTAATGETGDLGVIRNDALAIDGDVFKKTSNSTWTKLFNFLPYTSTVAVFTQPAIGGNETVSVNNTTVLAIGAGIIINDTNGNLQGAYTVVAKPTQNSVTLRLDDSTGGVDSGNTVPAASRLLSVGRTGPTGTDGTGLNFRFNSTTTLPVANQQIRFNNSNLSSVSEIYISNLDINSLNVLAILNRISQSNLVFIKSASSYAIFEATAALDSNTIAVNYILHFGSFANDDIVLFSPGLGGGGGSADTKVGVSETSTSRILTSADVGAIIECNNTQEVQVQIPSDTSDGIEVNKIIFLGQLGAGAVVLRPESPVTVNGLALGDANQIQTSKQWAVIELRKRAANTWWASQDWQSAPTTFVSPADANLISFYEFEEASGDLASSSGGGPTLSRDSGEAGREPGVVGQALDFTGSQSYSTSDAALAFASNSFYIAFWFERSGVTYGEIAAKGNWFSSNPRFFSINYFNTLMRLTIGSTTIAVATDAGFNLYEAYYNYTTNQMGIAVNNGDFVTGTPTQAPSPIDYSGTAFVVGARQDGGSTREQFLNGSLDQLRIHSQPPADLAPTGEQRVLIWNDGNGI